MRDYLDWLYAELATATEEMNKAGAFSDVECFYNGKVTALQMVIDAIEENEKEV